MIFLSSFLLITVVLFVAHVELNLASNAQCDTPMPHFGNGTGKNILPWTKWPGGVVTYELHSSLSSADRQEVEKAIHDIQSKTCIRFKARGIGDQTYTSIETDNDVCGVATVCRYEGYQFARFGKHCRNMNTMVHELGHTLCLLHEHEREDRDQYLDFVEGCEVPEKESGAFLRGGLYDYLSQMHYGCNNCYGGWPKIGWPKGCGRQVTQGLSVLDADKINDLYDCGGCHAHRWRPITKLTEEDLKNMVPFGRTEDGYPIHMCRAAIEGEVTIGKYFRNMRVCFVSYLGREYEIRDKAEVFTLPGGQLGVGNSYMVTTNTRTGKPVPCGTTPRGVPLYCAFSDLEDNGRKEYNIPGKVWSTQLEAQYFAMHQKEHKIHQQAKILRCGNFARRGRHL